MKIIFFAFGLWFIYWNLCGLCESLSAVWHVFALVIAAVLAGWLLREILDWLSASM